MRHRTALPLALALAATAAALPAPALAAVSAPQKLAGGNDVIRGFTAVAADGTARVAFEVEKTGALRVATSAPGSGGFVTRTAVSFIGGDSFGNAGAADDGSLVVVGLHTTNAGQASSTIGQVIGADGTAQRRTQLSIGTNQHSGVPNLAVNARGEAVAAWVSYSRAGGEMQVALRRAGDPTFRTAATLSGSAFSRADGRFSPEVAISPDGHVAVGFEAAGKVYGATGTVAAGVGRAVAVGTYRPNYGPLSVAAGDTRAVLAWTDTQYVDSPGGPTTYKASLTDATGTFVAAKRFGAPGTDEQPPAIDAPATAVTSTGDALVAVAPNRALQIATAPAGGSLGALRKLATVGDYEVDPAFAVAAGGRSLLTWTRDRNAPGGKGVLSVVYAATRPSGGAFGTPIAVSPASQQALRPTPALGADGTTAIAWVQTPTGLGNGNLLAVTGSL